MIEAALASRGARYLTDATQPLPPPGLAAAAVAAGELRAATRLVFTFR